MCLELILHTEKPFVFVSVCWLYLLAELVMSANNSRYADYMTLSDASVQTDRQTHTHTCCRSALWPLGVWHPLSTGSPQSHSHVTFDPIFLFILLPYVDVSGFMCVLWFYWPWPNIGSCSCQLLAQLRATFIAFPRWARGLRARSRSLLGLFPSLLNCFTFSHLSAQLV